MNQISHLKLFMEMSFFEQYHMVVIGCLFFSILMGMTFFNWQEKQWVKKHYSKDDIIALGFGITCLGLSSEKGGVKKYKGFLLIHKKGLLFKARFSDKKFDIPVKSIKKAYHDDSHKKKKALPFSSQGGFCNTT